MNLGKRRITNVELCACFEQLGFGEVAAFLASGNVVFSAKGTPAVLKKRIESGLAEALDYEVPTFIRTATQVTTLAGSDPFASRGDGTGRGKPQIALLARKPTPNNAAAALAYDTDDDWLALQGQELHWWPCAGVSDSELDFKALAKILGPPTVRTRMTIVRLVAKYFA